MKLCSARLALSKGGREGGREAKSGGGSWQSHRVRVTFVVVRTIVNGVREMDGWMDGWMDG